MSKVKVRIWNRDFELNVSYQNFPGEEITEDQQKSLAAVPFVAYSPARVGVESYIKKYFNDMLGNDNLDNIFRFVMPKSVLIPRTEGTCLFAIMCNFKFDMEHGIAIIFENGIFKAAGPQDLIL